MIIEITIEGKPIAKKRPRFVRRGKFVSAYNEQETEEGRWLWEALPQVGNKKFEGPVKMECDFIMPIPKSTSIKKRVAMITGKTSHTKKPDLDNCLKFVKDCLNGHAWIDDAQVVEVTAKKYYGTDPMTVIKIYG